MRIQLSTKINFHMFLSVLTILWINNGIFSYINVHIPTIVNIAIFAMWFLMSAMSRKRYIFDYIINIKYLLLFFTLLLFVNFSFSSVVDVSYYLKSTVFLMVIYSLFLYYNFYKEFKYQKFIFGLLMFDYIYIGINTFFKLIQNPGLSRTLSMSEEKIERILGLGASSFLAIGNYSFVYSLVFVGLFFAFKMVFGKKKYYIIPYTATFLLMLNMQFTIALMLLPLFTLMLLIIRVNKNNLILAMNISFIAVLSIVIAVFLPDILIFASNYMPYRVQDKFIELAYFLMGSDIVGTDFNIRLSTYIYSIESFIGNMLFGALSGRGKIGGHATWLDFLGAFGLLSLPIYIFFINSYKKITKKIQGVSVQYIKVCWLYFLLLGLINTVYIPRILLTIFIFVPFAAQIHEEKTDKRLE